MAKTDEILNKICGITTEQSEFKGLPRALTTVVLGEILPNGEVKERQNATSVHGELMLDFRGDYVQVNIRFESEKTDCDNILQILRKKDAKTNEAVLSDKEEPQSEFCVGFTFVPADLAENVGGFTCMNPIFYALTAKNLGETVGRLDTISMLFPIDSVEVFEWNDVDTLHLKLEINSEMESREYRENRAYEKKAQYAAEQDRIASLIKGNH